MNKKMIFTDPVCLSELFYLADYYKEHDQTDVAILLLQNFIKQANHGIHNADYKRVLALCLYNLAQLCTEEGDRLIARRLRNEAVTLWNETETRSGVNKFRYQITLQRLETVTERLVFLGSEEIRQEREIA
jgi:hypothetical protein